MKIERKLLWSVVTLILAVITVFIVMKSSGMSPAQLAGALQKADPVYLVPAFMSTLGIVWFEGRAVLTIVRRAGFPRKKRRGFIYAAADSYFSAITPSATGGQPASAFFMIRDKIPPAVATASLLANLVMYNAAILTIGFFCILLRPGLFLHYLPGGRILILLGIVVLTVMGILFFLLLWKQKVLFKIADKVISVLVKIRLMRHPDKWRKKLDHAMHEYGECVTLLAGSKRMWIMAYLFNVLQRVSQFSVSVFAYMALGGKLQVCFDLWVTQCLVSLGANCVPIPGSMGVTDYMMIDGYMNLMDQSKAYELQMLARGMSFYFCVLLSGLVVLVVYLRETRKGGVTDEKGM